MLEIYDDYSKIFKALCDPNRIKILDLLSCGEKCACELLKHFRFTQPTLSHHMKVLIDCNLVSSRKEGQWNHYSLNKQKCNDLLLFTKSLLLKEDDCICKDNTSIQAYDMRCK